MPSPGQDSGRSFSVTSYCICVLAGRGTFGAFMSGALYPHRLIPDQRDGGAFRAELAGSDHGVQSGNGAVMAALAITAEGGRAEIDSTVGPPPRPRHPPQQA